MQIKGAEVYVWVVGSEDIEEFTPFWYKIPQNPNKATGAGAVRDQEGVSKKQMQANQLKTALASTVNKFQAQSRWLNP